MSANRVTSAGITAKIVEEQYAVWPGTTKTICVLHLENGFTVTGEASCVDPANFDADLGRELAYKDAFSKIWPFEGYLLAETMFREKAAAVAAAYIGAIDRYLIGGSYGGTA